MVILRTGSLLLDNNVKNVLENALLQTDFCFWKESWQSGRQLSVMIRCFPRIYYPDKPPDLLLWNFLLALFGFC